MEKLKGNNIEVSGLENLNKVIELNRNGKQVIFAPNHVSPNSSIRRNLALAEDFPLFQDYLMNHGVKTNVLFRGDGDMEVGDSKVMKLVYDLHRTIFSALGRAYTGGIPLAINAKDPKLAMSRNIPSMKEIFKSLKSQNLTIYPYGNWFNAQEQTYDEPLAEQGFVDMKYYSQWRVSLKSGFIRIAKQTSAPIVPVYVDNTNGVWRITFGELIYVNKTSNNELVGQSYLNQMQMLRNKGLLAAKKD